MSSLIFLKRFESTKCSLSKNSNQLYLTMQILLHSKYNDPNLDNTWTLTNQRREIKTIDLLGYCSLFCPILPI